MINVQDNEWIPSDGYQYVSNGSVWSTRIFLGVNDNIDEWYDTNVVPPEEEPYMDETDALVEAARILLGEGE